MEIMQRFWALVHLEEGSLEFFGQPGRRMRKYTR